MAEHSKFIAHLLDPTEQTLIRQARAMGQEFDVLLYQARNIQVEPPSTDRLRTQLTISKGATLELRTFKEQATKLVEQAQVRSAIDPRLAAHITREAGKFLSIIDRLEERVSWGNERQNKGILMERGFIYDTKLSTNSKLN